ncbi:MAG: hypothetical protein EBT78_17750 [Betaproteobacteria bacterium]|nr:hypothetical protein [Betaproteobacteria bacterium]
MITLTFHPTVLSKLKAVMPKTNKAELALAKYKDVLERKLDHSLLNMTTNMFKFFKHFLVSTHDFSLEVGQFAINGKKQYLHQWLELNDLELVHVVTTGLIGSDVSTIRLTSLVTMTDAMDIKMLRQKIMNELDALLNDDTLSPVDFFYRVFPDFGTMSEAQLKAHYHFCPINIKSLQQYIVWLTHKANKLSEVDRQVLIRQANVILRIAQAGVGELPMLINASHFGRTYYRGINVQSVHKTLRNAMLGDCYGYDMRISVVSWKMGYARLCYAEMKAASSFESEFETSLAYLKDKQSFRESLMLATFGQSSHIAQEVQLDIVKQALTALSFGARLYRHGWIDFSGKACNPALVNIIKNPDARNRFIDCDVMREFIAEQDKLDVFIYNYHCGPGSPLMEDPELQTLSGRMSKSKLMSYLYQHAETEAMDAMRAELKHLGREVLASVHDAIFIRHKLNAYDKENIEVKMQQKTGISTWKLDVDEFKAYTSISAEVLADERAHKLFIAEQERLAAGYKPQNF